MDINYAIEIKSLSYKYPEGALALNDLSFSVKAGEKVALIGPNGAGKTTLLLAVLGIYTGSGTICVNGIELSKKTVMDIRMQSGLVFQDPDDQLFSATVIEDVAFAPLNLGMSHEEAEEVSKKALFDVNLTGFENRIPSSLSCGEKKRAAAATVLSYSPSVYLFDEPSSNLDPKNRRIFINFLKELNNTTVFATHDLDLAYETADRAVILNKGNITADASAKEILENEELLIKYDLELPLILQSKK